MKQIDLNPSHSRSGKSRRRLPSKEPLKRHDPGSLSQALHFKFPLLSGQDRLIHGVFTRQGGVSDSPYKSLNVSYQTGDLPERVRRNLNIIRDTIGARRIVFMNQVHGGNILRLRKGSDPDLGSTAEADALVTDIPSTALLVKQADCQGVIIFDRSRSVVSLVHCGWRGSVINLLGSVVEEMRSGFGCRAQDMLAAVGPSLGPCCAEFITHNEIFPEGFRRFMVREDYFDLWELSRTQLLKAGLMKENIEIAGICTRCNTDLFYSYRGEGETGRFATVAMIREPA